MDRILLSELEEKKYKAASYNLLDFDWPSHFRVFFFFFSFFFFFFFFFFFYSILRPFQDYFSSYETGQSIGGAKTGEPREKHLAHPQAELDLSHIWPVRGSNQHQTQR